MKNESSATNTAAGKGSGSGISLSYAYAVRNVTDFGCFVDIGVHQDGLVHISEIANRFIKHPSEAVKVGDVVNVVVLGVDVQKKRISLSIKQAVKNGKTAN